MNGLVARRVKGTVRKAVGDDSELIMSMKNGETVGNLFKGRTLIVITIAEIKNLLLTFPRLVSEAMLL